MSDLRPAVSGSLKVRQGSPRKESSVGAPGGRKVGMGRSAAATLGAILVLGGLVSAEAADVSALGFGSLSGFDGILPYLPQNWSDLPFTVGVSESLSYNSNLLNSPNTGGFRNAEVGGYLSTTNVNAGTKFYIGGDQFFADGTYGFYRYINHEDMNAGHYSGDMGVNWILTSKCSGR